MQNYEIRYYRTEEKTAIHFWVSCVDDDQARNLAWHHFEPHFITFEIWRDQSCIAIESRTEAGEPGASNESERARAG